MTFFNLADHFVDRHIREGRASKVAIRCGESIRTYGEVAADVNRVGNSLLNLGLQRERRVLLLLPDCPEFAAAYFGVIKVGAVAVPTSTAARAPDYDYFLRESEAQILIVHSNLFNQVAPVLNSQPYLQHAIVVGAPQRDCLHWDKLLAENSFELSAARTNEDEVAFWLWTSGSTGRPKAAVHLHRDWLFCCRNYASAVLGIGPEDI